MSRLLKVIIVGCGLIGNKRAKNINKKYARIVACFDIQKTKSEKFSKDFNCKNLKNLSFSSHIEFDVAFICTSHNELVNNAIFFLKKNKHVFLEKPGAINFKEILRLDKVYKNTQRLILGIGYNHRFHPSFLKTYNILKKNVIGELMFIRGQYGHGARLGYNKEWRAKKKISGGGELIDQGTHLIDLSLLFLGDLKLIDGQIRNYFWKMEVEDNCFLTLENKKKNVSFIQASCTEWKNTFNFEIYGKNGKIQICGLGGSYGVETLKLYKMKKEMGPPITKIYEYPHPDLSWRLEQDNFFKKILNKKTKTFFATLPQAIKVQKIIKAVYEK